MVRERLARRTRRRVPVGQRPQTLELPGEILGVADREEHVEGPQQALVGALIPDVWAVHHDPARLNRLDQVVPANARERPATEHQVGEPVDDAELAHAVDDHDLGRTRPLGTQPDAGPGSAHHRRHRVDAIGVAGHE